MLVAVEAAFHGLANYHHTGSLWYEWVMWRGWSGEDNQCYSSAANCQAAYGNDEIVAVEQHMYAPRKILGVLCPACQWTGQLMRKRPIEVM
jgi:hypothetical protein